MTLSVVITAYNHERFIEQALESVFQQRVSFPYEVIVGDDASTDGTRDVLRRFKDRGLGRMKLVFPEKNLGGAGAALFARALTEAQGRYVACLDGDDYWLGVEKLECQVRFLEEHPNCSLCGHRAFNLFPDGQLLPYEDNFERGADRLFYSLEDFVCENFVPTCSVVFRRDLLSPLPEAFFHVPSPDWLMNVVLAERGTIAVLSDVWGVRRVHAAGVISMRSRVEKLAFNIRCVRMIDAHLKGRYRDQAGRRLVYLHSELAREHRKSGRSWHSAWHAATARVLSLRVAART